MPETPMLSFRGLPPASAVVERIKGLLVRPSEEWRAINADPIEPRAIFLSHVAPLAALFVLAPAIGHTVLPIRANGQTLSPPFASLMVSAFLSFFCVLGAVGAIAYLTNRMAEQFGGKSDWNQALKLTAYSSTAMCLAGAFQIIRPLDWLAIAGVASAFTFYKGVPILMKTSADRALPYAAAVTVSAIVVTLLLTALSQCVQGVGRLPVPKQAPAISQDAEKAAKAIKQETAPALRDPNAPIPLDKLQRLLPEAIPGGWVRAELSTNAGGVMGFTGPTALARYERGGAVMRLHVVDLGQQGADRAIAAAQAQMKPYEGHGAYRRISVPGAPFSLAEVDANARTAAGLSLVANRIAIAADGTGIADVDLQAALKLIDMQRVAQIAQGY
jgi:hypothetical protein